MTSDDKLKDLSLNPSKSEVYEFKKGDLPIILSMPHNGLQIPESIEALMTHSASHKADTDWYLDQLYQFAWDLPISIINPKFSRYVIDLNRDPSGASLYPGKSTTELCPTTQFDCSPIYQDGKLPSENDIQKRVTDFWQPYHAKIQQEIQRHLDHHGVVVLFEAHSIASEVPRFFDGKLPDLNWGTNEGSTCDKSLIESIAAVPHAPFSSVTDKRFKGGYITRHYGQPTAHVHALQLEISQDTYMSNANKQFTFLPNKAQPMQDYLKQVFHVILEWLENKKR